MSSLIQSLSVDAAGNASRLDFSTTGGVNWPEWYRFLTIDGQPAYLIGNVCNTCTFFFERKEGAKGGLGVEALAETLEAGVSELAAGLTEQMAAAMPSGRYDALLLRVEPQATIHGGPGDYFTSEQLKAWGPCGAWNPKNEPAAPYYRAGVRPVASTEQLFEFIMPMFPPGDLAPSRIDHYRALIEDGQEPTALAISVLDVKYTDEETHWCLAHYLLDGHHKVEAAARNGRPITLVSFLAHEKGTSSSDQIAKALSILGGRRTLLT
ncbi:hypothetical protein G5B46_09880 [Caulobacter sp. 602-2]|uniref:Uncharacterized protein n=1 Tax=Caulobacter sp. 602-2 TaxID=2710887 RepID=A0A6G4QWQ0_9CAUL|nr:hypothetical protein [Caulobacter sp. 602-2]NGM49913.1 hypothetical protein [Caulobacter sp. 602-2]